MLIKTAVKKNPEEIYIGHVVSKLFVVSPRKIHSIQVREIIFVL